MNRYCCSDKQFGVGLLNFIKKYIYEQIIIEKQKASNQNRISKIALTIPNKQHTSLEKSKLHRSLLSAKI